MRKLLKDLRAACNSPFWKKNKKTKKKKTTPQKLPHKNRFFRRVTDLSLFRLLFSAAIFKAARAPEDAHNSCLSELLAPIMKFPDRESTVIRIISSRRPAQNQYYLHEVLLEAIPLATYIEVDISENLSYSLSTSFRKSFCVCVCVCVRARVCVVLCLGKN